jgi:hypothetical protein
MCTARLDFPQRGRDRRSRQARSTTPRRPSIIVVFEHQTQMINLLTHVPGASSIT